MDGESKLGLLVAFLVIVGLLIFGGVQCGGGCGQHYSDGERRGEIYKFSHKGLIFKSYEGELKLSDFNLRNQTQDSGANVWKFSITDPAVATQVEQALNSNQKVTLHYHQYFVKPLSQESDYTVDGVVVAK